MNAIRTGLRNVPGGLWLPLMLLVAAEIALPLFAKESASLAPPSEVAKAGFRLMFDGTLLTATGQTLLAASAGLGLGGAIGLLSGVFLGLFRIIDRLMEVPLEIIRPVPPVALIPIALMIFGFGYKLEIAIISFGVVWPILLLTRSAIAGIERQLMEFSALLRMTTAQRITKIVLPSILPRVFIAFRLAAGIALILAVTVEITINPLGLGNGIMIAGQSLDPASMLAYLIWIGVIGSALNKFLLGVQRRWFDYGPLSGVKK